MLASACRSGAVFGARAPPAAGVAGPTRGCRAGSAAGGCQGPYVAGPRRCRIRCRVRAAAAEEAQQQGDDAGRGVPKTLRQTRPSTAPSTPQSTPRSRTGAGAGDDLIAINCGGKMCMTTRSTLMAVPGSRLASMFQEGAEAGLSYDTAGRVWMDLDPMHFQLALRYLREIKMHGGPEHACLPAVRPAEEAPFRRLLEYLGLLPLGAAIPLVLTEELPPPPPLQLPPQAAARAAGAVDAAHRQPSRMAATPLPPLEGQGATRPPVQLEQPQQQVDTQHRGRRSKQQPVQLRRRTQLAGDAADGADASRTRGERLFAQSDAAAAGSSSHARSAVASNSGSSGNSSSSSSGPYNNGGSTSPSDNVIRNGANCSSNTGAGNSAPSSRPTTPDASASSATGARSRPHGSLGVPSAHANAGRSSGQRRPQQHSYSPPISQLLSDSAGDLRRADGGASAAASSSSAAVSQLFYVAHAFDEARGLRVSVFTEADLAAGQAADCDFNAFVEATYTETQLSMTYVARRELLPGGVFLGLTSRTQLDRKGSSIPCWGWKSNGPTHGGMLAAGGASAVRPARYEATTAASVRAASSAAGAHVPQEPLWRKGDSVELIMRQGHSAVLFLKVNGRHVDAINLPSLRVNQWSWYVGLWAGNDVSCAVFLKDQYAVFWSDYSVRRYL